MTCIMYVQVAAVYKKLQMKCLFGADRKRHAIQSLQIDQYFVPFNSVINLYIINLLVCSPVPL
jgi:hypothetical protein